MNIEDKIKELYGENYAGRDLNSIELYASWYEGYVKNFHDYRYYNGENYLELRKKSLEMPKKIAESWADLLINEKCDIKINENAKKNLDKLFDNTKFWTKANQAVEIGFALSYAAILGEINSNKEMNFVLLSAKNIIPLKVENDNVIDCAFYREFKDFTRLTIHQKFEKGYIINSYDFNNKTGKEMASNEFATTIQYPLFMFVKPNIINNNRLHIYNYGISIIGNSIDTLKAIDNKYDAFDFEFIAGKKRLNVSAEAVKTIISTEGGKTVRTRTFDPQNSIYFNLGENKNGDNTVTESGGELRSESFINSINFELSILSKKSGLGYGYFKFMPTGEVTATQVISENSDLFRTLKKHEILIRDEMISFVKAIIDFSAKYCDLKIGSYDDDEIDIIFDDSIIEDKEAEKAADRAEVDSGLMSYVDYAQKWKGMSEEDAKKEFSYLDITKKANKIMPLLNDKLITPELALKFIYGENFDKKLLDYLEKDDLNIEDGEFDDEKNK